MSWNPKVEITHSVHHHRETKGYADFQQDPWSKHYERSTKVWMTTHCLKVSYLQNVEFSRVFRLQHERERDHFFGSNCLRSNPPTSHNRGEGLLHKIIMSYMNLQTSKACKCVYKSVCMCVCVCVCVCVFLVAYCCCCCFFFTAAFKDDNNTSLLFISRDFYIGYSSHGMLLLLLHCYIQRQQQKHLLFSSLLFISRDFHYGYSSHSTNPQNKIHTKDSNKKKFVKNMTLIRRKKKIVDQIWQATQD